MFSLDVFYLLYIDDNVMILIFEKGYVFYVYILFEMVSLKYEWLNLVVVYVIGGLNEVGVGLDVW